MALSPRRAKARAAAATWCSIPKTTSRPGPSAASNLHITAKLLGYDVLRVAGLLAIPFLLEGTYVNDRSHDRRSSHFRTSGGRRTRSPGGNDEQPRLQAGRNRLSLWQSRW